MVSPKQSCDVWAKLFVTSKSAYRLVTATGSIPFLTGFKTAHVQLATKSGSDQTYLAASNVGTGLSESHVDGAARPLPNISFTVCGCLYPFSTPGDV